MRWRGELFGEQVEPDSAPSTAALLGRIPEQLCWPTPALAAPLVRRFYEVARLKCTAEARLVQPPAEEQLVDALEIAQGERERQQAECER